MTCSEFQEVLPEILEGNGSIEQQTHVQRCPECSQLMAEIHLISQQSRLLQASDEPSPRVWNSIEIALRQEGLIHKDGMGSASLVRHPWRHWTVAWLLPASAAFLVTFGVLRYEHRADALQATGQATQSPAVPATAASAGQPSPAKSAPFRRHANSSDDEQLLRVVGARSPAMRASYEKELQDVNAYIRDAEQSAYDNPNDEASQQYLMNAYEQKAVVYQLALDRTLP